MSGHDRLSVLLLLSLLLLLLLLLLFGRCCVIGTFRRDADEADEEVELEEDENNAS